MARVEIIAAVCMLLAVSGDAAARETAKILKCPPSFGYCYYEEKPILPAIREKDRNRQLLDYYKAKCLENTVLFREYCGQAEAILRSGNFNPW